MATIEVSKSHSLSREDARKKAEELAKDLETKLGLKWAWSGDAIRFEVSEGMAKGIKGDVAVSDKDIKVSIDLPFMLKMMKGMVEEKVQSKLTQLLGSPS